MVSTKMKILPFCFFSQEIKNISGREKNKSGTIKYIIPSTTNINSFEILYEGKNYQVPKTTAGSVG